MATVTQIAKGYKQPYGGFLNPKQMQEIQLNDGMALNPEENINPTIIGMAVDYMTRFMLTGNIEKSFMISLMGACAKDRLLHCQDKYLSDAKECLKKITDLEDESIRQACHLVRYDVWYRNPASALFGDSNEEIKPDKATIENIRTMVQRGLDFFDKYGPMTKDGFDFTPNGYTEIINAGDGDFLTEDTLWDFKVSKSKITNKHTLQLLIYFIMGKHSGNECFNTIHKIGVFNPRLNTVYLYNINEMPDDIIKEIEVSVIGY